MGGLSNGRPNMGMQNGRGSMRGGGRFSQQQQGPPSQQQPAPGKFRLYF